MKKKILFPILLLFGLLSVFLIGCNATDEYSYVTVDINPSIDFVVNGNNVVESVSALNQDGEILLLNLSLQNKNVDVAIEEVLDEAIDLGFIDVNADETIVEVSSTSTQMQNRFQERINELFQEKAMFGRAIAKQNTDLVTEATELDVEVGYLRLVYRALDAEDTLLKEDALLLTNQELIQVIKDNNEEMNKVCVEQQTAFYADRQVILDEYLPQIEALETEIAALVASDEDTSVKQAELDALLATMHDLLSTLRNTYYTEGAAIRATFEVQNQNKIDENFAAVNQFRQALQTRTQTMSDSIKEYQETGILPTDKQ
ncbi:MAG: hypothetical protein KJ971_06205 [Firmicutes bacterium]|nr:hypothetical protein [Bacillota bacterium]